MAKFLNQTAFLVPTKCLFKTCCAVDDQAKPGWRFVKLSASSIHGMVVWSCSFAAFLQLWERISLPPRIGKHLRNSVVSGSLRGMESYYVWKKNNLSTLAYTKMIIEQFIGTDRVCTKIRETEIDLF